MPAILALARDLATGAVTSTTLVEDALARIADPGGEGRRTFTRVYAEAARATADLSDRMRRAGVVAGPLAGLPISIKDLFDVQGEPTPAGSKVLAGATPAAADATIVARLRAAGAVIIGRTNMSEFAYSGLGLNPHHGTPRNPHDRAIGRIPGGSSSGAAISVTDGMAVAGIGTDTGGSVRIPAALCGLAGFKPTARRVPLDGTLPLATSLDSIGPIAATVACCAVLDAIMAGEAPVAPSALPLAGLRLGVVRDYVCDGTDATVTLAFDRAVRVLERAGAVVRDVPFPELHRLPVINRHGGLAAAESYAWHRALIESRGHEYDPRVARRIMVGKAMPADDYLDLLVERARLVAHFGRIAAPHDALLMPTTMTVAPEIAPLEADDQAFGRANLAMLRNTTTINFLDGCALSVPSGATGEAPTGLMVAGVAGADRHVLRVGQAIESALASLRA